MPNNCRLNDITLGAVVTFDTFDSIQFNFITTNFSLFTVLFMAVHSRIEVGTLSLESVKGQLNQHTSMLSFVLFELNGNYDPTK